MDHEHEIPPYFICPISLQIMKDPVIVGSGVSYDRSSIDRWLSAYEHHSCPVTNQPLADRTLTPNTTLLNLINSWAAAHAAAATTIPKPEPASKAPFDPSDIVRELMIEPNDPHFQAKSLEKIALSIQADPGRTARMEEAGITSYVASLITPSNLASSDLVDKATTVLNLLNPSAEALKQAAEHEEGELIETLISIMQRGSCGARIHAAFLLRSIFRSVSDARKKDLPPDLFDRLVEVLKDQNSSGKATMAALMILAEVVPCGRRNRLRAVEAGVVAVIVELLVEESGDERRRYCEAMLWVLELLCRKAEVLRGDAVGAGAAVQEGGGAGGAGGAPGRGGRGGGEGAEGVRGRDGEGGEGAGTGVRECARGSGGGGDDGRRRRREAVHGGAGGGEQEGEGVGQGGAWAAHEDVEQEPLLPFLLHGMKRKKK